MTIFFYPNGWLVDYPGPFEDRATLAEENFDHICDLIRKDRERALFSHRYTVHLVENAETSSANLVVTTSDNGSLDDNPILSMLFTHNNPKIGGSVEHLGNPRIKRVVKEAKFTS